MTEQCHRFNGVTSLCFSAPRVISAFGMKISILMFISVFISGCETALIYTAKIDGSMADEIAVIEQSLDNLYDELGFVQESDHGYQAINGKTWLLVNDKRLILWLGHRHNKNGFTIRLVPQPRQNEFSMKIADAIRKHMELNHPEVVFVLEERPELDLFR